jgi:hypothetical protein
MIIHAVEGQLYLLKPCARACAGIMLFADRAKVKNNQALITTSDKAAITELLIDN